MGNIVQNKHAIDQHWSGIDSLHKIVAILLALLLAITWYFGRVTADRPGWCAAPAVAQVAAPAIAEAASEPIAAAAPVVVETPVVVQAPVVVEAPARAAPVVDVPPAARVYFAVNKTGLPSSSATALADVIAYLKTHDGAKATVVGFHDPRGDAAHNNDLALGRAKSVAAALTAAGIGADRVIMQKPAETAGSGTLQEARRVEVSVRH